MKKWINDILFSFPLQLLLLHLRSNLLLILTWIFLVLLMTGMVGNLFGVRYLFLTPEYLGEVNSISYFILGLGYGIFFMTWNLACYILIAHHFPFLASLQRPFTKFCLNNSIIPIAFLVLYVYLMISFNLEDMFTDWVSISLHTFSFLGGVLCLVLLATLYFFYTNKDILSFLKLPKEEAEKLLEPISAGRQAQQMKSLKRGVNRWRVDTYLNESLKPRLVRPVSHYDPEILLRVFKQNHVNALIVQILGLMILVALGLMIDNSYFRIPAGTSIFILGTIFLTITGAIIFWFNQWSLTVIIGLFFLMNFMSTFDSLNHKNQAYGLDYTSEKTDYNYKRLTGQLDSSLLEKDKQQTIARLENWRAKFPADKPPKILFYCVSGGGAKASVWVMKVMQEANIITEGKAFDHTALITGASGGMIGAAYLRELHLQSKDQKSIDPNDPIYIDKVSRDMLNSICFTLVSNDLFLPWLKFNYNGFTYRKDRGYMLENVLIENTDGLLDKPLSSYKIPEQEAQIPSIILSPYIVNDGRQLLISPQGVSYLTIPSIGQDIPGSLEIDAVDFGYLFQQQNAEDLRFTSALRMNATYPYILPNVHMPSKPVLEIMDAGLRDNYGLGPATRFIDIFKDWILENTAGVVLVQITTLNKIDEIEQDRSHSLLSSMVNPLGVAGQILHLQDYELDNHLSFTYELLGPENFEMIRFIYSPGEKNPKASVTFHLTAREKRDILASIDKPVNVEALNRLQEVLE
ncbi:MAG: patatin-like phospholipase family protein [Saprospiraceae bacterium]|nr:patatin-like phospholipase family protein [Saprospiraceae bacterium]